MIADDTRLKILVLSNFYGGNASVIQDYLFSFNAYSRHKYFYIFNCNQLTPSTDLSAFDVILIFWSAYLPGPEWTEALVDHVRSAPALKLLFLQDEYRNVREFNRIMARLGIQVMFTCVAEADHSTFYPSEFIPSLERTYSVLTGYLPPYLENLAVDRRAPRMLDIAYRSRAVPAYLGDLGQEKTVIAERFQQISLQYGFKSDISVREQDRIYGANWIDFLKSARMTLGTSSGASVIDFSGEIGRNVELYRLFHPQAPYRELKDKFFAGVDGKYVIDTISPRTFEATALGCTLVQHEGHYGGFLQPDVHYICVRKDYSNLDEVVQRMRNEAYCRQLAENTHRDLIASGKFTYRAFIEWFDRVLDENLPAPISKRGLSARLFYAHNYVMNGQAIVPDKAGYRRLPESPLPSLGRVWRFIGRLVSERGLMRLAWSGFREGRREPALQVNRLLRDTFLLRLAIRSDQGREPGSVRVTPWWSPQQAALLLVSHAAGSPAIPPTGWLIDPSDWVGSQWKGAAALLRSGQVRRLIWDHSACGRNVAFHQGRTIKHFFLGMNGVTELASFTAFARRHPDAAAGLVESIAGGGAL